MLPPQDNFIFMMKSLDVRVTDTIVCYDKVGMLSSPRAYWMFKTFGVPNVYILNGTFTKWKKENRPTESGDNRAAWHRQRKTPGKEEDYDYILDQSFVTTYDSLHQALDRNTEHDAEHQTQIIDARFETVYNRGKIPTSKNIPFPQVLNEDKTFKSADQLRQLFESKGGVKDPTKDEVVLTC